MWPLSLGGGLSGRAIKKILFSVSLGKNETRELNTVLSLALKAVL